MVRSFLLAEQSFVGLKGCFTVRCMSLIQLNTFVLFLAMLLLQTPTHDVVQYQAIVSETHLVS